MTAHWAFVAASYGFAIVVVAAMAISIVAEQRNLRKQLERLEARTGASGHED
jgi:heme exporter protein CcmD